jgi:hypothetical protein
MLQQIECEIRIIFCFCRKTIRGNDYDSKLGKTDNYCFAISGILILGSDRDTLAQIHDIMILNALQGNPKLMHAEEILAPFGYLSPSAYKRWFYQTQKAA